MRLLHSAIGRLFGPALIWPLARLATPGVPRVLMYHRFSAGNMPRKTCAEVLRQHILIARRTCDIVTFSELGQRLSNGRPPPRRPLLALTVDDGYRDFFEHAYPVLRELQVPATIFVTAGFVQDRAWLWPDAIEYLVGNAAPRKLSLSFEGRDFAVDLTSANGRHRAWDELATAVVYDTEARVRLLTLLQEQLHINLPDQTDAAHSPMTWDEVAEIARNGVEIGGHTWSHAFLPDLDDRRLARELVHAKSVLEQHAGHPVRSFAYPNGQAPDAPDALCKAVRAAGYEYATVATSPTGRGATDWLRVGRWAAGEDLVNYGNILSGASSLKQKLSTRVQ